MNVLKQFIGADQVDDTKILLRNAQYLRGRNAANSANINLLRVNASDIIEFASQPQFSGSNLATEAFVTARGVASYVPKALVTANVTVSNPGTAVFDSVTLTSGQLLFLAGQTTQTENGLWTFNASGTALTRPTGWTTGSSIAEGTLIVVDHSAGAHSDQIWKIRDTAIIGTNNVLTDLSSGSSSGASTSLNNLTATSINQDLIPDGNGTRILGGASFEWGNAWLSNAQITSLFGDGSGAAPNVYNGFALRGSGTSTKIKWYDTGSNTNYVSFQSPASIAADITWTLPNADGTSGQVLKTNGAGILGWVSVSAGAFALQDLSNLTNPTSINQHLLSASNSTYDIGSTGNFWRSLYVADIRRGASIAIDPLNSFLKDASSINSVDWDGRNLLDQAAGQALYWGNPSIMQIFKPLVWTGGAGEVRTANVGTSNLDISTNYGPYVNLNINTNSGALSMASGPTTGTGISGDVSLSSGGSAAQTGIVDISTGTSTGGSASGAMTLSTGGSGGNTGAMSLISGDAVNGVTGDMQMRSGTVTGPSAAGSGNVNLITGNTDAGNTGQIQFITGDVGSGNGNAGGIHLVVGATVGLGSSNGISLSGGSAVDGNAGAIQMGAGSATGTGTPGYISLTSGNAPNGVVGGAINLVAGAGTTAKGGSVIIAGGDTSSGGQTGDVILKPGQVTGGGGTPGFIKWQSSTATVGYVLTATNADGSADWMPSSGGGLNPDLSNLTSPVKANQDITSEFLDTPVVNYGAQEPNTAISTTFGTTNSNVAVQFTLGSSTDFNAVEAWIAGPSRTGNIVAQITTDNAGVPGTMLFQSSVVNAATISYGTAVTKFPFFSPDQPNTANTLAAGVYWIVLAVSGGPLSGDVTLYQSTTHPAPGNTFAYNGTWSDSGQTGFASNVDLFTSHSLGTSAVPWKNLFVQQIFATGNIEAAELRDFSNNQVLTFADRIIHDTSGNPSVQGDARQAIASDGSTTMIRWADQAIGVLIGRDLLPVNDNTNNLGSTGQRWASGYIMDLWSSAQAVVTVSPENSVLYDGNGQAALIWEDGNAIFLKPNTGSGLGKQLYFYDQTANNFVGFRAANSLGADVNYVWPLDGTSGQVLSTNGSGVLSWITSSGSGANTALSNLITTSINQDLLPDSALGRNLGSPALPWGVAYTETLQMMGAANAVLAGISVNTTAPNTGLVQGFHNNIQEDMSVYSNNITAIAMAYELGLGPGPAGGAQFVTGGAGYYFQFWTLTPGAALYYVWVNTGTETDPGPGGSGYMATVTTGDNSGQVATAIAAALGTLVTAGYITASAVGNAVFIANTMVGAVTAPTIDPAAVTANVFEQSSYTPGVNATSGTVSLQTGNATNGGTASLTGGILLYTGTPDTGGTRGQIRFNDGSEGTSGYVWTSTNASGDGHWMAATGGGANTALSNLASTAVNADIVPGVTGTVSLGYAAQEWASIFTLALGSIPAPVLNAYVDALHISDTTNQLGDIAGGQTVPSGATSVLGFFNEQTNPDIGVWTSNAAANTGNMFLETGNSSAGISGNILIKVGDTVGADAAGSLNISGGNSVDGAATNIYITTGSPTGTGPAGSFFLQTGETTGLSGASGANDQRTGAAGDGGSGYTQFVTGDVTGSGTSGQWNAVTGGAVDGNSGALSLSSGGITGNGSSGAINFTTGSATGTGTVGGLSFQQGNASGSANLGDILIAGGSANNTGTAGNISIISAGLGTNGSGAITITSGQTQIGGTASGTMTFGSGNASSNGNTGPVYIKSGSADQTQDGESSGQIFIQSGPAYETSGDLNFTTGNSSKTTGAFNTGQMTFTTGTTASAGSRGAFVFDGLRLQLQSGTPANFAPLSSDPGSAVAGDMYYNTTSNKVRYYNGTTWADLGAGSSAWNKERIALSGTDITNQYIDLAHVAQNNSITFMAKGGNGLFIEGGADDYSVSYTGGAGGNTRITFLNDIATGGPSALTSSNIVVVQYQY